MDSGQESIVINRSERAVSSDVNRLQALGAKATMEVLRWLLDVQQGSDELQAGGQATEFTTPGTPMRGEVLGGLCVVPQNGLLGLGVVDGAVLLVDPAASPVADDSVYKNVADAGGMPVCFSTAGNVALAMTPNASAHPRIDVVECRRIDDPNPEMDSRDIYNPTTSLFTATTVQKTQGSVLQYRVRVGTPNAGFPGVVSRWLPLAVVSVPSGAATNDQMTFWDVRPLVNDRVLPPTATSLSLARRPVLRFASNLAAGPEYLVNGIAEVTSKDGSRRLGGQLLTGSPVDDATSYQLDLWASSNQEDSFTLGAGAMAFLYLMTPFGLPRWARYATTGSPRLPRSPRGIPIVSTTGPYSGAGFPKAPIVFPPAFGFAGASSQDGVCWGAAVQGGPSMVNQSTSDGWTTLANSSSPVSGVGAPTGHLDLTENIDFPSGATAVRFQFSAVLNIPAGAYNEIDTISVGCSLQILDGPTTLGFTTVYLPAKNLPVTTTFGAVQHVTLVWEVEAELPTAFPTIGASPYAFRFAYAFGGFNGAFSISTVAAAMTGWKL